MARGVLKITASAVITGPIGDGTAIEACEEWAEQVTEKLGERGVELLREFPMNKTGRARGGFQEALHTVRRNRSTVVIPGPMDRGVTWAPWLEGTSSRNRSTTFKGYHLFRQTRQQLEDEAPETGG